MKVEQISDESPQNAIPFRRIDSVSLLVGTEYVRRLHSGHTKQEVVVVEVVDRVRVECVYVRWSEVVVEVVVEVRETRLKDLFGLRRHENSVDYRSECRQVLRTMQVYGHYLFDALLADAVHHQNIVLEEQQIAAIGHHNSTLEFQASCRGIGKCNSTMEFQRQWCDHNESIP